MEQQIQQHCGDNFIVVIAVDHSKHSDHAFDYYVKDIHKAGNSVHVITVTESWPSVHPMDGGPSPGHMQELKKKDQEHMEQMKTKYQACMEEKGITGEFVAVPCASKHLWHDIVTYQEKVNAGLIVLGTRGLGAFRRTVMGSVSDGVVHHAQCPVLVCRHA